MTYESHLRRIAGKNEIVCIEKLSAIIKLSQVWYTYDITVRCVAVVGKRPGGADRRFRLLTFHLKAWPLPRATCRVRLSLDGRCQL